MTPLPDGYFGRTMPQRQVMVVEKDSGRCKQLCALLSNHDLIANPARSVERVLETQEWPGVILIGDKNPGASGWELAKRIRAIDSRVPIILLGNGSADSSHLRPMIQSYLPHDAPAELIVNEVERWLKTVPAARQSPQFGEVLLVDDDSKLRKILQAFLELKGFTIATAASGEEALEYLAQSRPKAILLDVRMPGMDGILTLKHIRVSHPNLPVIFITQDTEDRTKEEAVTLGVRDYLVKPFDFEHLEAVLLNSLLA